MITPFAPQNTQIVVSVVFAAFTDVVAELHADLERITANRWMAASGRFSFGNCFVGAPPAGAAHPIRVLALDAVTPKYTLFTANLADGWNSLGFRLSVRTGVEVLTLGFCDDAVTYPHRFLSRTRLGSTDRAVSVIKERRWCFFQQGAPLPEEDLHIYSRRIISQRLQNADILAIAEKIGLTALSASSCFSSKGVLLETKPR